MPTLQLNTMETAEAATSLQRRQRRMIFAYVVIAFTISWAVEIPLALVALGILSWDIPFGIHYFAAFGPGIAGIILSWLEHGNSGPVDILARCRRWRVGGVWWIVAVSPLLAFLVAAVVISVVRGELFNTSILNHFDFLPDIGVAIVLVWLTTYGFGEEIGWRGYLLPRLQRYRSSWSATLILWIIWAIWHVPSFFYLHTVSGVGTLLGFLVGMLAGAIFLTWLYNSSGGSILLVAVWHGLFDYVSACTECKSGVIAASVSTVVMVWAIVLVLLYTRKNLSTGQKQIA